MIPRTPTGLARILALFAIYGCATLWLTWPLAQAPFTHLPCTNKACAFDTTYSAWVLGWGSHALLTPGVRLADANIFFPAPDALYYGPAGFGALPYYLPAFLLTGHAGFATNAMLLLSATLSALSLHWVVRRWTGLESAGFVAGAGLLVHPWYLWGFVGVTPHLAPLVYFALIAFVAARQDLRWRDALLLVLLIVAQCLTDPVYVAAAVVAPLGLLALSRLARRHSRRDGLVLVGVLAVSLSCLIPFLLGYLRVRAANPGLAQQTTWTNTAPPTWLEGLFWSGSAPTTIAPAALVLIALGLVLVARRALAHRPLPHDVGWRHGALWLLAGAFVSLTPTGVWRGGMVYLPQALLAAVTPLYEVIRVPQRLGVAALIGACLLSGIAFAELVRGLPARATMGPAGARALHGALAVVLVVLLYTVRAPYAEPIPASYPIRATPTIAPTILAALQSQRSPVVGVPGFAAAGRLPIPHQNAVFMYLSTFHWRPLVNGYSSYWPEGFVERMEVVHQLPNHGAIRQLVQLGVRTIWLDLRLAGSRFALRWRDAELGLVRGLQVRAREDRQVVIDIDPRYFGGDKERSPAS